jgi:hypothetical protein
MYLSEGEIYKTFFTTVKELAHRVCVTGDLDTDAYSFVSEVTGMVRMTEELVKEEEK